MSGHGALCAIQSGSVRCDDKSGVLGGEVAGLFEDRKGHLWIGLQNGLWRWKPGPPQFYPMSDEPIGGFAEGDSGALLISTRGGVRRFIDGKIEPYPLPGSIRPFAAYPMLSDRDDSLWIGALNQGLIHVHHGRVNEFSLSDGLSGDIVSSIFEDKEGNIWVATAEGLDRFRDFAVATFSVKQGLSDPVVGCVLADADGSVWISTYGGLDRWNKGQITTYGKRDGKINGHVPNSLLQDRRGRIWASTRHEFGYLENGRLVPIRGIPGHVEVHGTAQDAEGNLWVANREALFRLSPRSEVQQIPWDRLGHTGYAWALAADPLRGGMWPGFIHGGIAYFRDGQVRASYATADGLGAGPINRFLFDRDNTIWIATEGGLSRLKNGHVATLTSKNGLPCDAVHWVIEDNDHSFWLYMPCGLIRISRSELDAWGADIDQGKDSGKTIRATVFDTSEGVRALADSAFYNPQVAKASDGRLWFLHWDGASVIDPRHIPFNKLPPHVHIEQIVADSKTYNLASGENEKVRLPKLIRDVEIDYTALSFVDPAKNLFRYKLEGRDLDWQQVGNRRQAFYTNLPPGNYRFRVIACNSTGVWNEAGASLDFSVAPAWFQTNYFRIACVAAFLTLMWGLSTSSSATAEAVQCAPGSAGQ
jgi:ligand-binding sensor domain-containing protein